MGVFLNVDFALLVWGVTIVLIIVCGVCYAKNRSVSVPLQKKSKFLSGAQKKFFDVLIDAVGHEYCVFARVGFLGVIEVAPTVSRAQRKRFLAEVENDYFDFVLVNSQTMAIFAVIELQDFSAKKQRAQNKRKQLLSQMCQSVNVKLLYFDVREDYQNKDVGRIITGKARKPKSIHVDHHSELALQSRSFTVYGDVRVCPKCRSELVAKIATKGRHMGKKFLLCRKYPVCDYRIAANNSVELSSLDEGEQRRKDADQRVYNKW